MVHMSILAGESGRTLTIQITRIVQTSFSFNWTAWCSNENHAAMVMNCFVYLNHYFKYFEVDLIGPKATNQKQEILNPLPCHLSHHTIIRHICQYLKMERFDYPELKFCNCFVEYYKPIPFNKK